jgi:ArsR family transcriptional regulator
MNSALLTAGPPASASACCAPLAERVLRADEAEAAAALFRALADPARVRILNLLATSGEPVCVCNLTAPLGLAQPTVSHHLRKLLEAGLVSREQRGTWAYYSLDRPALARVRELIELDGAA